MTTTTLKSHSHEIPVVEACRLDRYDNTTLVFLCAHAVVVEACRLDRYDNVFSCGGGGTKLL